MVPYNSNYNPNQPKQDTRPIAPFSNLGLNVGVTFYFGKNKGDKKKAIGSTAGNPVGLQCLNQQDCPQYCQSLFSYHPYFCQIESYPTLRPKLLKGAMGARISCLVGFEHVEL